MVYQCLWQGKYRKNFLGRLGFGFSQIPLRKKLIWIHAPSLGETKAVASLAKLIRDKAKDYTLLVTSTTETGYEEAKKSIPFADHYLYLPFDFSWIIRPIVKRLRPAFVLLCESDFWYNFLDECKKRGAFIALANGKLSERSLDRHLKAPFISKHLFSKVDLFCLQSQTYSTRFQKLGLSADKIHITGNIKLDTLSSGLNPAELKLWKRQFHLNNHLSITFGSSHAGEELLILEVMERLWQDHPDIKLFLVPRHPERFSEVAALLKKKQIKFVSYSNRQFCTGEEQVIFIDAVGILKHCYQVGDIAIVGGSFIDSVGGHNIIEPCYFGKPVLYGPHMFSQPDLVVAMKEFRAGIQTNDCDLASILLNLMHSEDERNRLGNAGIKLINAMRGASERTFSIICNFFPF